jgi:arylsulfatase A-like enzyme
VSRPNILQIIWHDLGRHLHCYGWQSARSPNLDRLASEGALFERAFCTAPLCSPSRGALMTGRYPHQNGLMGLTHRSWRFNKGERFLPQLLRDAGYQTLLFGLQHEVPVGQAAELGYGEAWEQPNDREHVVGRFSAWIGSAAAKERPFFACCGFREVHRLHSRGVYTPDKTPNVQLPHYLPDLPSVREDLAGYEGLIDAGDEAVGAMLSALDRSGLAANTLVLFTTDHGTDMPRAKSSLYDPGIETALIVRLPGVVKPGARIRHLISNVDVLPTYLNLAKTDMPSNLVGHSFWPLLVGKPYRRRTEIFAERTWHATYDPIRCIRTERHKFIHNFRPGKPCLVPPEFIEKVGVEETEKHFAVARPEFELYDLEKDPDEFSNVAGRADYADVEAKLRAQLQRFLEDTEDPILWGDIPHPGRHSDVWDWQLMDGKWRLYDPLAGKSI